MRKMCVVVSAITMFAVPALAQSLSTPQPGEPTDCPPGRATASQYCIKWWMNKGGPRMVRNCMDDMANYKTPSGAPLAQACLDINRKPNGY